MSLNDNPDSIYYSDDKSSYATIKRRVVYTVESYTNDEIVNRVTYYTQDLAENSAEDFVLERK
jgi:hypothetical protein